MLYALATFIAIGAASDSELVQAQVSIARCLAQDPPTPQCPNDGIVEEALEKIHQANGAAATRILVELLGINLDGIFGEEHSIYLCERGKEAVEIIRTMSAKAIAKRCVEIYRKSVAPVMPRASRKRLCADLEAIARERDMWLQTLPSHVGSCEP